MEFAAITKRDKLGREIVLRSAEEEDALALIGYLQVTTAESPFLIREPEEVTLTPEQERAFIRSVQESARELMLVAYLDGKHAGNCSLMSAGSFSRYRHRCSVAIALYKAYWGCGIGRLMMEAVLNEAKKLGYEQAELEVVAGNEPAVTLYRSLGFEVYGRMPDNMKYPDGTYADTFWMMKKL
ncbi:MAG: GNAT family N-acetyltransferase [Oscillospiraceae bacterium]|nr:GNAT family N-acetyltransferase [Oscillospiraceae bacterium]